MSITHYSILVELRSRWSVVTIDTRASQVTVPSLEGGHYAVRGTGERSISQAASYTVSHRPGHHWSSRAGAVRALRGSGYRVWIDEDGDSRVDVIDEPVDVDGFLTRPRGRPRSPDAAARRLRTTIRVSPEDLEIAAEVADREGIDVAEVWRAAVRRWR